MMIKKQYGQILLQALIVSAIATIIIPTLIGVAINNLTRSNSIEQEERAFQIAEAGIEYYRWHLAHDPTDFQDGTGKSGPYIHEYFDKDGNTLGSFLLDITAPPVGSTVVTIRSTGIASGTPSAVRIIESRLAIPSFAKYAVAANDHIRFGEGTEIFGPIHSNQGVRVDGTAHGIVTSALATYNDPDHAGGIEFGVHTHRDEPPATTTDPLFRSNEAPPTNPVPMRGDVFLAGRNFAVPAVDFSGLSASLAEIKTAAQSEGLYFGTSNELGYHIVLKTDDTFDLYEIDSFIPRPNGCTKVIGQQGWDTWSIQTENFLGTYPFPENGLVFIEDDVWVEGKISTAHLTIAAGRFPDSPGQRKSITINNDLTYTHYDGQDIIGLIAQQNINAGLVSEDDLRIDGALIAQNGRVGRYYYRPPSGGSQRCAPYDIRDTITLYGTIATNKRYGFAYSDGTGYQNRNIIFDANLLYGPPPSFPLTSENYETISWEEIRP